MMSKRHAMIVMGGAVFLIGVGLHMPAGADDIVAVEMEDVLSAWRQRAASVRKAAYWFSAGVTEPDVSSNEDPRPFATRNRAFEVHLGNGPNILVHRHGEFEVTMERSDYYEFVMSTAFNGKIGTELYGDGYPNDAEQAFVNSAYTYRDEHDTLPIILMHRPFEGLVSEFDIRDWHVSGLKFARDGTRTIAIASNPLPLEFHWHILVDPRRDYVPIELQLVSGDGDLVVDIVVSYGSSATGVLHPQEWRVTHFNFHGAPGKVSRAIAARVDRVQFDDQAPRVSYEIAFKPGTVVHHGHLGQFEVIRHDGSRTRFPDDVEFPGTRIAEELNRQGSSYGSGTRWVGVGALVAALLIAGVGWRILKRRYQ